MSIARVGTQQVTLITYAATVGFMTVDAQAGEQSILEFAEPSPLVREQQPGLTVFALGMTGLGALGLVLGDFAMQWQPVAQWFPARTVLAYGAAVLMVVCGIALLFQATVKWAVRVLFAYSIVWALLKMPAIVVAWKHEGVWLAFGEIAVLMAGAWTLFAQLGGARESWFTGDRGVRWARYWFAAWLIPIGLSHFVYIDATVNLVPAWLPNRQFWGYLTGAGQIASGLGVLFGVLPRVAAWCEAGQITLFTLLVWVPAVLAAPRTRLPWTALWISWAIGAGAWVVAQNVSRRAVKDT
jgi:uncharacterized membrane protein